MLPRRDQRGLDEWLDLAAVLVLGWRLQPQTLRLKWGPVLNGLQVARSRT